MTGASNKTYDDARAENYQREVAALQQASQQEGTGVVWAAAFDAACEQLGIAKNGFTDDYSEGAQQEAGGLEP